MEADWKPRGGMMLECRCGYRAKDKKDLDEHIFIMVVILGDEKDHGEK